MGDGRRTQLLSKSAQEREEVVCGFYKEIPAAASYVPELVQAAIGTGRASDQAVHILRRVAEEVPGAAARVLEEGCKRRTKKGLGLIIYLACQPAQRPHWPGALEVALAAWRDLLQQAWKHPYKQATPQDQARLAMQDLGSWENLTVGEAHEIVAFLRAFYDLEPPDPKMKRDQWNMVWSVETSAIHKRNRAQMDEGPTVILEQGLATIDPERSDEGWYRIARGTLWCDPERALAYARRAHDGLLPSAENLRWRVPYLLGDALLRNGQAADAVRAFEEGLDAWRQRRGGFWLPDGAAGWLGMIKSAASLGDEARTTSLIEGMAADAPRPHGNVIRSTAGLFTTAAQKCVEEGMPWAACRALDFAKSQLDRWSHEYPQTPHTKAHTDYDAVCRMLSDGEQAA